jgi:hypothetical protein
MPGDDRLVRRYLSPERRERFLAAPAVAEALAAARP